MRNRRDFLAVALAALGGTQPAWAAARKLRIGVIATLSPGTPTAFLSIAMRPLKAYLEDQTGLTGEIARGGDALDVARSLNEGSLQLGIFHGHEYAWAKAKYGTLEPLVTCINPLRSVRAYLVASPRFNGNLQGQTVALPRDSREHCRLYFERRCVPAGTDANAFYRRISRPAEATDALDEVASDRAQVTVVDAVGLEQYQKANPKKTQLLRLLYQSEEFPPGVLAYDGNRLAAADVTRIREALINAKNHPRGQQSLQVLKLATFETPDKEFKTALETIAKIYPPPTR